MSCIEEVENVLKEKEEETKSREETTRKKKAKALKRGKRQAVDDTDDLFSISGVSHFSGDSSG